MARRRERAQSWPIKCPPLRGLQVKTLKAWEVMLQSLATLRRGIFGRTDIHYQDQPRWPHVSCETWGGFTGRASPRKLRHPNGAGCMLCSPSEHRRLGKIQHGQLHVRRWLGSPPAPCVGAITLSTCCHQLTRLPPAKVGEKKDHPTPTLWTGSCRREGYQPQPSLPRLTQALDTFAWSRAPERFDHTSGGQLQERESCHPHSSSQPGCSVASIILCSFTPTSSA